MTEISVILPVYQCAPYLVAIHEALSNVLPSLAAEYEIVFVDDGSSDNAWDILVDLSRKDKRVKAYKLSRNFGQHAAISAGLSKCSGRWAVVMDCDMQDPPQDIPRLYEQAQAGHDIVLAKRVQRGHSFLRRLLAKVYFRLLSVFTVTDLLGDYGTFSIISRPVIDAYLSIYDRNRHYLMILSWLGFDTAHIEYKQASRSIGRSSYTFLKLLQHAIQGVFFQTTILLQLIVYLGLLSSFIGILAAGYLVFRYFVYSTLSGWTSIVVLILLLAGFILIAVGVVGLYIGEIFDQVKGRPLFVVYKELNCD